MLSNPIMVYLFSRFRDREQDWSFWLLLGLLLLLDYWSGCGIFAHLREGDVVSGEEELNAFDKSLGDRDNVRLLKHLVKVFQFDNYMVLSAFGLCHTFFVFLFPI